MRTTHFILCLILLAATATAQPSSFRIKNSCSFDDIEPSSDAYLYDPSDEADRIVTEIVDALGLTKNFIVRASGVRNAVATEEGGRRYILYSTTFLEKFKGDDRTRWAAYAVLAHEIGHHLNNDNFGETDMRRRKICELEADRFSGSVLRMLGADLDEAQGGIESLEKEAETATHPSKPARREAVATGWKNRDEFLRARGEGGLPKTLASIKSENSGEIPPAFRNRKSGLEMVKVLGGTFLMGSPDTEEGRDNDECQHSVTLASFNIGKYEVTQADWKEVMESYPENGLKYDDCGECVMRNVSWNEVQEFIQILNARYPGKNYRLPQESEWEFAARGGNNSHRTKYAGSNNASLVAWYNGNGKIEVSHLVGLLRPNELGLFDMSGNVWEWCFDKYGPYSGCGSTLAKGKILRGGSANFTKFGCRSANRAAENVFSGDPMVGFRLVHN